MSRKKTILSEPNESLTVVPRSSNGAARPRRPRDCLGSSVLEELWSIWRADPRVPSVKSRRSWAISRNANPRLVDGWFLRRKTCAKKTGQPIPDGSYDLPLDLPIVPRREQSPTPIESEPDTLPDLPSDDTLVYPEDNDDLNDVEASSDTMFDEDALVEPKRIKTPAYKEAPQQSPPGDHHSQPNSSFIDLDRCDEHVSSENPFLLVCSQGRGKPSDFTCILCSMQDKVISNSDASPDSRVDSSVRCPRLEFFPDAFSELSAIPFLFRTPRIVRPDNVISHQSVGDWTIVEDELGRLVNEGGLDFSFLDVPHLVAMELLN